MVNDWVQVCSNGHMVNSFAFYLEDQNKEFCTVCGAKTILTCPTCNKPIGGTKRDDSSKFKTPSYCGSCGSPYPWTVSRLEAAQDLINEMNNIDDQEKKQLNDSVHEMTKDTPQALVASVRYRKIMSKVGKEMGAAMRDIIIDIVSETIRKTLFG